MHGVKLGDRVNQSQLFTVRCVVIHLYDYCQFSDFRQTSFMQCPSSAGVLPRRDFLKLAGAGAATLALTNPVLGDWFLGAKQYRFDPGQLARTHDLLSLSDWGPYSKKHFGITHIPDVHRGLSFDFSIFPLLTHGPVKLPSVTEKSGVHPWEASPDLEFYSLRFEIIGQDQFFGDLSFSRVDDRSRLLRLELVNQTDTPQEVTLNCLAQLVFPPVKELTAEPIRLCTVELPPGAVWIHALDYARLQFATSRPTDNLVTDGLYRGEERAQDSVGGSVIAQNFGKDAGDTVVYQIKLEKNFTAAMLIWRFQMEKGESVVFQMTGAIQREITFRGNGDFTTVIIPLGRLPAGKCELCFTSAGGAAPELNGFVLAETENANELRFVDAPWQPVPEIQSAPSGLVLKYENVTDYYGFVTGVALADHRELKWSDFDRVFGTESDPNTKERIFGNRRRGRAGDPDSLFVHAFSGPVTVAPHSRQLVYGLVCTGTEPVVRRYLSDFNARSVNAENIYRSARTRSFHPVATPAGEDFKFSQQLMSAVTLTNLTYPLYVQRNYVRQFSPGKIWDCLYTWDSGFIGLGLLEIDFQRTLEILNAYTTPPGAQSAFIHHGSPVPVQIYLFYELWNRTQSREILEYFYPRLRQYHQFLAGRLGSSTTRRHPGHLISTWDYFYNSGGWDDYPPQKFVHQNNLTSTVAPIVNSAHVIRCAKLLRLAAAALDRPEDFAGYDSDIAELSASLHKYSWDAASGYFGYVAYDNDGEPSGILRDEKGVNFNMGLDGVYPLTAGICSAEQEQIILQRLFSIQHLWMADGITTVDQSAPYFNPDGYWNGSVWFAHQWFLWKTMLDLGRGDLANQIALAGLKIWKRVTNATYDCMEHFVPREPFGAGWHQFSSLSSPALSWFASLYTPGRLTCGFEVWLEECYFSRDNRRLRARLKSIGDINRPFSVLACMGPDARYRVLWNGAPVVFTTLHDGLLQIQLPRESKPGELKIAAV
jgi:hypothetical protein